MGTRWPMSLPNVTPTRSAISATVLLVALLLAFDAHGQRVRTREYKGAVVSGNKATLKPGYVFVPIARNKVGVARKAGSDPGPIEVDITCYCMGAGSTGGCAVSITHDMLFCKPDEETPCTGQCTIGARIRPPRRSGGQLQ